MRIRLFPDPVVCDQVRLGAPASAVFALETASQAIGNVAGFVIFVLSTVINLRYSKAPVPVYSSAPMSQAEP